jgi:hypothetical protein
MHPNLTTVRRDCTELQSELNAVMGRVEKLTAHVNQQDKYAVQFFEFRIFQRFDSRFQFNLMFLQGKHDDGASSTAVNDLKQTISQLTSRLQATEQKVSTLSNTPAPAPMSMPQQQVVQQVQQVQSVQHHHKDEQPTYPARQQIERIELALAQSDEAIKVAEEAKRRCMILEPQAMRAIALTGTNLIYFHRSPRSQHKFFCITFAGELEATVRDAQLAVSVKAERSSIDQLQRTIGALQLVVDDKVSKATHDNLIQFTQRLSMDYAELNRKFREESQRLDDTEYRHKHSDEATQTLQKAMRKLEAEMNDLVISVDTFSKSRSSVSINNSSSSINNSTTINPQAPQVFVETQNGMVTKMYVDEQLRKIYENLYKFREVLIFLLAFPHSVCLIYMLFAGNEP